MIVDVNPSRVTELLVRGLRPAVIVLGLDDARAWQEWDLRQERAELRNVPVIVIGGVGTSPGGAVVLAKPCEPAVMLATIARVSPLKI